MISIYNYTIILLFSLAVIVFILLFFISAPYGKFRREGWGPSVKSKWAWMVMEFPSPAIILLLFVLSENKQLPKLIFLLFWLGHYIYRTFLYPFRQSGKEKFYPVLLVLMAFLFNCMNGYVNGFGVFSLYSYNPEWFKTWQFIGGTSLFLAGFIINKISDEKLRGFRKSSPCQYVIPHGWLFNYISSPHYLGEIIEWGGWAVMTWSLPGLAFFVFTFANLFPRAIASHKWYRKNFPEYPLRRKALIPFLI